MLCSTLPRGTARANPLVTAIEANYVEEVDEYELPDTVQTLLWACCSPNEYGAPEVSQAIRSGDDRAVSQLLNHGTKPSRREDGGNDPFFLANANLPS